MNGRRSGPPGAGISDISPVARQVLRGIRNHLDENATLRISNAEVARLSGVTVEQAESALNQLSRKGMVRLDRATLSKRHGI